MIAEPSPETAEALRRCGEAALDLAAMEHFGRIRDRLSEVDRITRPPHFAPQFPYHSEIDMPVIDPAVLLVEWVFR